MFGLVPFRGSVPSQRKNDLLNLRDFIDDFFYSDSDFFSRNSSNSMKVDIKETEKEYLLEAEIPGVDKKDIKVNLKDGILTISVDKVETKEEKNDNYVRKERRYGSYSRSFSVYNISGEEIDAKYENGILKLTFPKKEKVEPKENNIEIH
jgi:HSP20 family protein